jgi:mannosyl-3-phosphoglycerate phosphatase
LRALLRDLPPGFQGFGDLSAEGVAQVTGLDLDAARAAQARRFTEPGLWTGDEAGLAAFLDAAAGVGLTARRGGRFLTLSFGATKRDQMDRLIRRFAPVRTVALGDAPNDVEMLTHADLGVIVANPASLALPPLPGEAEGRIRRTRAPGPLGWAEAMTDILNDNRLSGDSLRHG